MQRRQLPAVPGLPMNGSQPSQAQGYGDDGNNDSVAGTPMPQPQQLQQGSEQGYPQPALDTYVIPARPSTLRVESGPEASMTPRMDPLSLVGRRSLPVMSRRRL